MATTQSSALAALAECDRLVSRLDKMCCEPGRSPSMRHLADTLNGIRSLLEEGNPDLDTLVLALEDAGSQIGRLQVGCCTAARMPLYSDTLVNLTTIQLAVTSAAGLGHE